MLKVLNILLLFSYRLLFNKFNVKYIIFIYGLVVVGAGVAKLCCPFGCVGRNYFKCVLDWLYTNIGIYLYLCTMNVIILIALKIFFKIICHKYIWIKILFNKYNIFSFSFRWWTYWKYVARRCVVSRRQPLISTCIFKVKRGIVKICYIFN